MEREHIVRIAAEALPVPRHRWMGMFWATSLLGVASGLYTWATAALPLTDLGVITGAGAPFVAGAGLTMVIASLMSLWWAWSRVEKPLRRFSDAVDGAVADGFSQRISLARIGVGPALEHAAMRLQDITVSITDAGLQDGDTRLRLAFRGTAADRFENIMTALNSAHETILTREDERDALHRRALSRADLAAEKLEQSSARHDAEHARLHDVVTLSRDGLASIRTQLGRLARVDPAEIDGVVDGLRDQALAIDGIVRRNEAAANNVNTTSAALAVAGRSIVTAFETLTHELSATAESARAVTVEREAVLTNAVVQATDTLVQLEAVRHDVSASSDMLRSAGQTFATTASDQSVAITASIDAMGQRADNLVHELLHELGSRLNQSVIRIDGDLLASVTQTSDALASATAKVSHLTQVADSTQELLTASARMTETTLASTAAALSARLHTLTNQATGRLEAMALAQDARLTDAVAATGQAAIEALLQELAPVREAAADHADWLRAAMAQMREETDRLADAQQAAIAVRALSEATEAQLRTLSDTMGERATAMAQTTDRALHEIERSAREASRRMTNVHGQADRATQVLTATVEPLVGLLGRTRTMLDNMAEIEQSQLAPALRRIQANLTGLAHQLEETDENVLRNTGDAVRRALIEFASPYEAIAPSLTEQKAQFASLEASIVTLQQRGEALPEHLVDAVGTWCADKLHTANARMKELESGIGEQIGALGNAIAELKSETPITIQRAVDDLALRIDQRPDLEKPLSALQRDFAQQLASLEAAYANTPRIDADAIQSAAENAAQTSIATLADGLKAKLEALSAVSPTNPADNEPAPDLSLGEQIEQACRLIEAVEQKASAIAHAAVAEPGALARMPDAIDALHSAERALGSWSRQLDNVSTAVAIAMDVSSISTAA